MSKADKTAAQRQARRRQKVQDEIQTLRAEVAQLRTMGVSHASTDEVEELRAKLVKLGKAYRAMEEKFRAVEQERNELRAMVDQGVTHAEETHGGYMNEYGVWCER